MSTEAGEVEEEEERHHVVAVAPNLPVTVQKTNRVDVTERFGKFDIRQELERKLPFVRFCSVEYFNVVSLCASHDIVKCCPCFT